MSSRTGGRSVLTMITWSFSGTFKGRNYLLFVRTNFSWPSSSSLFISFENWVIYLGQVSWRNEYIYSKIYKILCLFFNLILQSLKLCIANSFRQKKTDHFVRISNQVLLYVNILEYTLINYFSGKILPSPIIGANFSFIYPEKSCCLT